MPTNRWFRPFPLISKHYLRHPGIRKQWSGGVRNQKLGTRVERTWFLPRRLCGRYTTWLKGLSGNPVFVAYPAAYDFMFIYWYLIRFAGESPFSHSALDIKTYAMALIKRDYRASVKRNMPRRWFSDLPHTHVALDDAIGQGILFCNMLSENLSKEPTKT